MNYINIVFVLGICMLCSASAQQIPTYYVATVEEAAALRHQALKDGRDCRISVPMVTTPVQEHTLATSQTDITLTKVYERLVTNPYSKQYVIGNMYSGWKLKDRLVFCAEYGNNAGIISVSHDLQNARVLLTDTGPTPLNLTILETALDSAGSITLYGTKGYIQWDGAGSYKATIRNDGTITNISEAISYPESERINYPTLLGLGTRIVRTNNALYFVANSFGSRIIKTDFSCKKIWDTQIAKSIVDTAGADLQYYLNGGLEVEGGIIVIGQRLDRTKNISLRVPNVNTITKLDTNGNIVWQREYPYPDSQTIRGMLRIKQTSSGDIVVLSRITKSTTSGTLTYPELLHFNKNGEMMGVYQLTEMNRFVPRSIDITGNNKIMLACSYFRGTTGKTYSTLVKVDWQTKRIDWKYDFDTTQSFSIGGCLVQSDLEYVIYGNSTQPYLSVLRETPIVSSVDNSDEKDNLHIHPIPADGYLTVDIPMYGKQYVATITTMTGSVIRSISGIDQQIQIPTNQLSSGMYMLHVNTGEHILSKSFLVLH
ncbi:MAG: T9SS type A sorting domain-containing protein [Candidatus Kapabacteria bacterium]|nr:T9SS type A sorting domain-containing protein [Candidatus Kapabacteria bacterium]